MKKYKVVLGIEYNGYNYSGWQKQINMNNTIQFIVELAISHIANQSIYIKCAGRTDKKVHALEQVIHFTTNTYRKNNVWVKGINHFLPKNIRILWAIKTGKLFHATKSVISREYLYIINNNKKNSLFFRNITSYYPQKININKIKKSILYLIGIHDFTSFRNAKCQSKQVIKNLIYIKIKTFNNFIFFYIRANSFLYHMVRNIISNLLFINDKKLPSYWLKELLISKNNSLSAPPAKPEGLYLFKIYYKKNFYLPNIFSRYYNLPLLLNI